MRQLAIFLVILATFYSSQAVEGGPVPEFCSLPPEGGPDTGNVDIYLYFDSLTQKCTPFRYHGTGGNDNRFRSEVECMRNCSDNWEVLYPQDRTEACHLKKAPGECVGRYLRFYYDSVHQKCHSFFWTGCVGNGNRFLDMSSCNATCQGITDAGDDPEEEEHDTQVGLILGIILGIVGAAILIAVIVLAMQSKSSKSKKAPKDTATSRGKIRKDDAIEMNPSED